ncbi:DNA repair photolyase [Paenibacillaceae bacterium GAS479]|nr:DNA repair photolyase [Paenibacillaceae bacterium GAS479]
MEKILWNEKDFTIEYLKTSITINSYIGCNLGCEYCILSSLEFPEKAMKIYDEASVVEQLLIHKYFTRDLTPISVNNKSDPLLPEVKQSTFRIFKILEQEKLKNPIYLISKMELSRKDIEFLDSLELNIYVFYSFSGLGDNLEKVTFDYQERRIQKLKAAHRIKKIHYWRPLIVGQNDDEETIKRMIDIVAPIFDASIVSGLRVNEKVNSKFQELKIDVPFNDYTKKHKYVEKNVFERINQLRNIYYPNYLLFRHTSCLTSYWQNKPDFLHNDRKPTNCIVFNCPNTVNCSNRKKPDVKIIAENLNKIGRQNNYVIKNDHIMFEGAMSQEDLSYLNINLGFKALSEKKELTVSESVIEVD